MPKKKKSTIKSKKKKSQKKEPLSKGPPKEYKFKVQKKELPPPRISPSMKEKIESAKNPDEVINAISNLEEKKVNEIVRYYRQPSREIKPEHRYALLFRQAKDKHEIMELLKTKIAGQFNSALDDLKDKISTARKGGQNTKDEELRIMLIPGMIKIFRATFQKKDRNKLENSLNQINESIEAKLKSAEETQKQAEELEKKRDEEFQKKKTERSAKNKDSTTSHHHSASSNKQSKSRKSQSRQSSPKSSKKQLQKK